ncbi:hypothetical protein [Shiella aurantiaca]|uniref:hypothetical protein n=1 Tax=Shiella aurantiaca TaxID=3058365 RepID=UPI0029F4ED2E|nr:hypothetical protein [Shiella aurantiaca]
MAEITIFSAKDEFIWKLMPDIRGRFLYLELRDKTRQEMRIAQYTEKDNSWKYQSFPWWSSIKGAKEQMLAFQHLNAPQDPSDTEVYVQEMKADTRLWTKSRSHIVNPFFNGLMVKSFANDKEELSLLAWETGKPASFALDTEPQRLFYPSRYHYKDEYFDSLQILIERMVGELAVKQCEYIEREGCIIISYYCMKKPELVNNILVVDSDGEVVYHQPIDKSTNGQVADGTFFVWDKRILFIKDKTHLISLSLV